MRQATWIRGSVVVALGLGVVAIGLRRGLGAGQPIGPIASMATSGAFGGDPPAGPEGATIVHIAAPPMSPEATRVWLKLQDKVAMPFGHETSLEDVLKYIAEQTKDANAGTPAGIKIYVDPQGLQDADKTLASTIVIDLEGIPLATTLPLVLKQLGLAYHINKDGLLIVTSPGEVEAAEPSMKILEEVAGLREEIRGLRAELKRLELIDDQPRPKVGAAPK